MGDHGGCWVNRGGFLVTGFAAGRTLLGLLCWSDSPEGIETVVLGVALKVECPAQTLY